MGDFVLEPVVHDNMATRHWMMISDIPNIQKDASIITNFGERVESTL